MNPKTPASQLYEGPLYADSLAARNLAHLVGQTPALTEHYAMQNGRYMSGLGSVDDITGAPGYDPSYQGQHIYDLEREDDTFGSGIFDPSGRSGTSNSNMGIFASYDSLPGFIAREVPFTVSRDVTDITDDADVVSVPGGGMAYVESRGKLSGAAITGPTWRPPALEPAGYTQFDQVYAKMNRPGQCPAPPLNPNAPEMWPAPRRRPARSAPMAQPVPGYPSYARVPLAPSSSIVPERSIVAATQFPVPLHRAMRPIARAAPDMPTEPQVRFQQTVNVGATRGVPLRAVGAYTDAPRAYSTLQHMRQAPSLSPPGYTWRRPLTPGGVFGADETLPTCPPGQIVDIDTMQCVPAPAEMVEEEKKPASAAQLAFAGVLVGAAVGLLMATLRVK